MRVFVTRELHPFTAGGIGRVIANLLATSTPAELRNTAIVWIASDADAVRFKALHPDVRLVARSMRDYQAQDGSGRRYPLPEAYGDHRLHAESVLAFQALASLEAETGPLGYVEFPDWGGMAFASCQEKRLGRALQQATLAVRLHTTDSVLHAIERRRGDVHALALHDLERKALADCDLIVGQLGTVAEAMRQFYAFDEDAWTPRLVLHAPPVIVDGAPLADRSVHVAADTPITFTSKIQAVKRPEVVVRACSRFLLDNPQVTSQVQFIAHAFDQGHLQRLKALVPPGLSERFVFLDGLPASARDQMIARSVCVFPSSWESFCLAAYEASRSGACCLVNTANPAFGEATPWKDGKNCHGFDGTVAGLVGALETAFGAGKSLHVVEVPDNAAPWQRPPAVAPIRTHAAARVSAIVTHCDDATGLIDTLDSLAGCGHSDLELIVVDRGSRDHAVDALLSSLADSDSFPGLRLLRLDAGATVGEAINAVARVAQGDCLLIAAAGDTFDPAFVGDAAGVLSRHPAVDVVASQAAAASAGDDPRQAGAPSFETVTVFCGEARASGLHQDRYTPGACVVRAALLREIPCREDLPANTLWDLHMRAVSDGRRYVVASTVDVVSARAATCRESVAMGMDHHDVLRDKRMRAAGAVVPLYALLGSGEAHLDRGEAAALRRQLEEYTTSESVFAALKLARFLDRHAPRLLALLKHSMRLGWRAAKAMQAGRSRVHADSGHRAD